MTPRLPPPPEPIHLQLKRNLKDGAKAESLTPQLKDLLRQPSDSDLTPYQRAKNAERLITRAVKALGDEQTGYLMIVLRLQPGSAIRLGQRYKQAGKLLGVSGRTARHSKYRDTYLQALAMQLSEMLKKIYDEADGGDV